MAQVIAIKGESDRIGQDEAVNEKVKSNRDHNFVEKHITTISLSAIKYPGL